MTEFEQNLLFAGTAIVLGGTLIVFVWQWLRGRGRDDD
jgi:hypothetical protein